MKYLKCLCIVFESGQNICIHCKSKTAFFQLWLILTQFLTRLCGLKIGNPSLLFQDLKVTRILISMASGGNEWPLNRSENEVPDVYSFKLCSLFLAPNHWYFIEKSPNIAQIWIFGCFLTLTNIVCLQSKFCGLASCLSRLGAQHFWQHCKL